jgi:hypothetical protein
VVAHEIRGRIAVEDALDPPAIAIVYESSIVEWRRRRVRRSSTAYECIISLQTRQLAFFVTISHVDNKQACLIESMRHVHSSDRMQ